MQPRAPNAAACLLALRRARHVNEARHPTPPHSKRPFLGQIARAAKAGNWSGRFNIHVGGYDEIEGDYGWVMLWLSSERIKQGRCSE
jgi:hypothetical protein